MDRLDYKILSILQKNARETASNISKEVHLSVSAVLERIRKMEESGVIKEYTIILNEKVMKLDVTALMEVSLEHPRHYDFFTDAVLKNPNVVECYYLTGDFDFVLKISCSSSEHLESIHREIKNLTGVSGTRTHFVLKTVKNIYSALPEQMFGEEGKHRKEGKNNI